MNTSEMFDDQKKQGWEIKPPSDNTWDTAMSHFVLIYRSKENLNWKLEACKCCSEITIAAKSIILWAPVYATPTRRTNATMRTTNALCMRRTKKRALYGARWRLGMQWDPVVIEWVCSWKFGSNKMQLYASHLCTHALNYWSPLVPIQRNQTEYLTTPSHRYKDL